MDHRPLSLDTVARAPEWMRKIPLRPDRWRDDCTRSAVAVEAGVIVAAGMMWTSRVHGDRYWFEVAVDPRARLRGHGRAMLSHLSTLRPDDRPFIARGYVDEERMSFVRALGGRTIQVVPPATVDVEDRHGLRRHPAIRSAASVAWADLCAANADVYEWTHADWSPVGVDFAAALNEDLADELDVDATSVAVVDGRISATCMVYRDSAPPIVTAEAVHARTRDGESLVEGCVRRSLDALAERGVTHVEFDGHVSDPHFLPVWTRLNPSGRWFHLAEVSFTPQRPVDDIDRGEQTLSSTTPAASVT